MGEKEKKKNGGFDGVNATEEELGGSVSVSVDELRRVLAALREYAKVKQFEHTVNEKAFLVAGNLRDQRAADEALGAMYGVVFATEWLSGLADGKSVEDVVRNIALLGDNLKTRLRQRNEVLNSGGFLPG